MLQNYVEIVKGVPQIRGGREECPTSLRWLYIYIEVFEKSELIVKRILHILGGRVDRSTSSEWL